jgi:predicted transposase/invertase (TIGR01784 family)
LNPILGKDFDEDKLSVLDILAEDEHGRKFNIEMQTSVLSELPQRLTYYLSALYSKQLTQGSDYSTLRQAVSICVLTKSMFPEDPRLHLDFRMRDSSGLILTNDLQIHLLQLPNLRLTEDNIAQASPIERWAYFLLNADRLSREDVSRIFPDQEFAEAAGVLEMISKSPEEHRVYDMRLKFQRDEATRLAATQREIEAARSAGVHKGVLLGRIAVLQELLDIAQPTADELSSFDESRLTELALQLRTQLRNRNS